MSTCCIPPFGLSHIQNPGSSSSEGRRACCAGWSRRGRAGPARLVKWLCLMVESHLDWTEDLHALLRERWGEVGWLKVCPTLETCTRDSCQGVASWNLQHIFDSSWGSITHLVSVADGPHGGALHDGRRWRLSRADSAACSIETVQRSPRPLARAARPDCPRRC